MTRQSKKIPLSHRLQEKWLRLPALLKHHDSPRCFGTALHDASHILITMPANPEWHHCTDELDRIIALFREKQVVVLGSPPSRQNSAKEQWVTANPDMSLRQAGREPGLWEQLNPATDLFFDLNPDFNLLNILICHRLRPAVRFCFEKPYCHAYYNFVFSASSDRSFSHRLEWLNRFLEPIMGTPASIPKKS
ncbi:MAG TPA: hypothetical protein ENN03_11510 [bacterium]|nr:hypothetical protein [bacterium]